MANQVDDVRIQETKPLVPPAILIEEIPRSAVASERVSSWRHQADDIVNGTDRRLLVITGPCSVHDPDAVREYAARLKAATRGMDELMIVVRTYFEKPRTVGGWKGFINDPDIDESHQINKGLRKARTLLRDIVEMGMPCATEFLDMTVPQHISDFICWSAIGARTVESQTHRELASGLSMPVGFKNATDGRIQPAVDAVLAARMAHWFPTTTKQGVASLSRSTGNPSCHVVLRGGASGPNYSETHIAETVAKLEKANLPTRVMVDCSHGNSSKDHTKQAAVAAEIARQIEEGSTHVLGVMIESHLIAGRQEYSSTESPTYGQSITDACVSLEETIPMLEMLAKAVQR